MIRSLRWRLQAWHAVVLTTVLSIFGVVVYHLQWQTRLHQIDAELNRTAEVLTSRLRRLFPKGQVRNWRPPMEQPEVLAREWLQSLTSSGPSNSEMEPTRQNPPTTAISSDEIERGLSEEFLEQRFGQWPFPSVEPRDETTPSLADEQWLPDDLTTLFEGR